MPRTDKTMEKDVARVVSSGAQLYYPGGSGGGGGRRGGGGNPIVLPHARTSPTCQLCSQYHTTAEHDMHGGGMARLARKATTKKAATRKKTASAGTGAKKRTGKKAIARPRKAKSRTGGRARKTAATKKKRTAAKKSRAKKSGTKARRAMVGTSSMATTETAQRPRSTAGQLMLVTDAVRQMPASGRFGPDKVFVSDLWDRVGGRLGMTLGEFKQWLVAMNRARHLDLRRADLIGAMNRDQVTRSEIQDMGSNFHFVHDKDAVGRY